MELGKAEILGTKPELPALSEPGDTEEEEDRAIGRALWSANGVSLVCDDYIEFERPRRDKFQPPEPDYFSAGTVSAYFEGRISPASLAALERDLKPLLPITFRVVRAALGDFKSEHFRQAIPFVKDCCNMLLAPPTKKDTTERRIANAIRLIAEADAQKSNAVQTALYATALEALLGRKGDDAGIAHQLAENVASLLEPVPANRSKAVKFVKDLYDKRSRVLHGEDLAGAADVALAQRLVAGVLYRLCDWRSLQKRSGEEIDSRDGIFNKLRDLLFEPHGGARSYDRKVPLGLRDLPEVRAVVRRSPKGTGAE